MKKIVLCVFCCALLATAVHGGRLSLRVNAGGTYLLGGDYNKGIEGFRDYELAMLGDSETFVDRMKKLGPGFQLGAELLYRRIGEEVRLTEESRVLGLYCGSGAIELSLAGAAGKVTGIDSSPVNIANAVENALVNRIDNAAFDVSPTRGGSTTTTSAGSRRGSASRASTVPSGSAAKAI